MKRTLAAVGTALLLTWPLAGCSGDDSSDQEPAGQAAGAMPSDSTSDDKSALNVLPNQAPALPTAPPQALAPSGATFDACEVVSPELVTEVFGAAAGQALPQESGLGDPQVVDCYHYGAETLIAVQATTRADEDMPENVITYDGIPGAVSVPGADRGWAVIFPDQEGSDTLVSGLILVKGQLGLNLAISITGHPYDIDTVLEFAEALLERM